MSRVRQNAEFWKELDAILAACRIVIDRPKGSRHPSHDQILYPLDYGYLQGTRSPDGEGIDVWIGSEAQPRLKAAFLCADSEQRDSEIKLLLGCMDAETELLYGFYNDYPDLKALLICREENE